jgi:hypothetical protein
MKNIGAGWLVFEHFTIEMVYVVSTATLASIMLCQRVWGIVRGDNKDMSSIKKV